MPDAPFPGTTPPTIVGVKAISYSIYDPDPDDTEESQSMTFEAQIEWSNGRITTESGNVVPHLTNAEVSGLQNLVARLRGKAEAAWGDA